MITGKGKPDAVRSWSARPSARLRRPEPPSLDPSKTIWQEISGVREILTPRKREVNSRSLRRTFNFSGTDQQKPTGILSGGREEQGPPCKGAPAGGQRAPPRRADERFLTLTRSGRSRRPLQNFAGCAVVISHDRWFLDRIADAHTGVRGGEQGRVVRRKLLGVRAGPEAPASASTPTALTGSSTKSSSDNEEPLSHCRCRHPFHRRLAAEAQQMSVSKVEFSQLVDRRRCQPDPAQITGREPFRNHSAVALPAGARDTRVPDSKPIICVRRYRHCARRP